MAMKLCDNNLATSDDYLWKTLVLDCPQVSGVLSAKIFITQPQGFKQQVLSNDVCWSDGKAYVKIFYPLVDDGRYEASHGNWNGAWELGEYLFKVALHCDGEEVAREEVVLDPKTFFPSDRMLISVDARPQIIECATRQMLYTDEGKARFMIRIRDNRVSCCHVEVDVTARQDESAIGGPWRYQLSSQWQDQEFSIDGWQDGEYWLRIRVIRGGEPIGPYCIRKFWVQAVDQVRPEVLELAGHPEVLVDDWSFDQVEGVQFVPDVLEKKPDEAIVTPTESHEEEMLSIESIEWNDSDRRYEAIYKNSGGRSERKETAHLRAHLKMLLISEDGEHWEKPKLGIVEYDGSTENNILRDDTGNTEDPRGTGGKGVTISEQEHDIEHAQFRFYDPQADGPVNIDNVFIASGKRYFPFQCKSLNREGVDANVMAKAEAGEDKDLRGDGLGVMPSDGGSRDADIFSPRGGEHWPFEKRGDLYLVLKREPLFYLGVGMDLMHTTESIRCHVEQTDRKRLFYYYRPAAPAYPPHGAVYDNMHLGLRCLAVIWTDDGLNYHRQFVLAPDSYDRIGSQFYSMGMMQKFGTLGDAPGRPVLDKCLSKVNQAFPNRNLYLGSTLLHWGIEQTQAPELIWTRDLLNFHRFKENRRSMIENGKGGTYNFGMIREKYKYHDFNGEWWHHYTAVNTRHNGYGVMARIKYSDVKAARPNFADAPYFETWEGCIADGKQTKYLPGIARCKPYRLAHAEPVDIQGVLRSRPVRVDGNQVKINAQTQPGGFILVEIHDQAGKPVLSEPFRFQGDEVSAVVADVQHLSGKSIVIKFTLEHARLYAFEIASE